MRVLVLCVWKFWETKGRRVGRRCGAAWPARCVRDWIGGTRAKTCIYGSNLRVVEDGLASVTRCQGHLAGKVLKHKTVSDQTFARREDLMHRFDGLLAENFCQLPKVHAPGPELDKVLTLGQPVEIHKLALIEGPHKPRGQGPFKLLSRDMLLA